MKMMTFESTLFAQTNDRNVPIGEKKGDGKRLATKRKRNWEEKMDFLLAFSYHSKKKYVKNNRLMDL